MVFGWQGADYDTADMRSFETGQPGTPLIFVTAAQSHVFVITVDHFTGTHVHRAEGAEIARLANTFHLPELLNAIVPQANHPAPGALNAS